MSARECDGVFWSKVAVDACVGGDDEKGTLFFGEVVFGWFVGVVGEV